MIRNRTFARAWPCQWLAVACLALVLSGCETVKKAPGLNMLFGEEPVLGLDPTAEAGVDYEIAIRGLGAGETEEETAENSRLRGIIEGATRVHRLQDKPPPSLALLRRRASADRDIVEQALKSEGYYEGEAEISVGGTEDEPSVTISIRKGPRYALARQRIALPRKLRDGVASRVQEAASVNVGGPGTGPAVVEAEGEAIAALEAEGWPYADRRKRRAEANYDVNTLDVVTQIEPGPYTVYGDYTLDGLTSVERKYVESFIPWKPGDPVSERQIAEVQRELASTRLFDAISVKVPPAPPEDWDYDQTYVAPVEIVAEEAQHRTARAGLSYSTTDGFGASVGWEHRNLFGQNETVNGTLSASQVEQRLRFDYRKPRWSKPDRDLIAGAEAFRETTDAYDIIGGEASIGIEERFNDYLTGTLNLAFEGAQTEEDGIKRNSYLLGLPGTLAYDRTDDLLNPSEGFRASALVAPWGGVFDGDGTGFLIADLQGSTYLSLDRKANYILALRARAGAVFTDGSDNVPPRRRLYSGGGGSVRAFRTQYVNPLDGDGDPIGALSVAEGSAELRMRFGSFGVVPFIDAGTVSEELFADYGNLRWGGGLGLRYFSPIGPIRVDVAIPFDKRSEDDSYQLYLSIGQAF